MPRKRRICFVTGTRAEFGLMRTSLEAIRAHPRLDLQLVVTGMHMDRAHGRSIDQIRAEGWKIDASVRWSSSANDRSGGVARATGLATARLSEVFARLKSDLILVVGDRVEAFAAASAGHISQIPVAHVHGGDRAEGVIDDSLRHAITKLSHIHFPATRASARRLERLGEDPARIHRVGTPGVDEILQLAAPRAELERLFPLLQRHRFAMVVMHPDRAKSDVTSALDAIEHGGISHTLAVYPNNDPGASRLIRVLERRRKRLSHVVENLPRDQFLGLMRDAAVLVGNSSSGIIEAASFGTPVVNIGPRQDGRERSENVTDVPCSQALIGRAIAHIWRKGRPKRFRGENVYGRGGAGPQIARILARTALNNSVLRKLISY